MFSDFVRCCSCMLRNIYSMLAVPCLCFRCLSSPVGCWLLSPLIGFAVAMYWRWSSVSLGRWIMSVCAYARWEVIVLSHFAFFASAWCYSSDESLRCSFCVMPFGLLSIWFVSCLSISFSMYMMFVCSVDLTMLTGCACWLLVGRFLWMKRMGL